MFDSVTLSDPNFNPATGFNSLQLQHPSPGSTASNNERHLDVPQTYESLLASNTSLKTRVNELELIYELFRDSESRLRRSLEDAQKREDELNQKVGDLERQLKERDQNQPSTESVVEPLMKKPRLSQSPQEVENLTEEPAES